MGNYNDSIKSSLTVISWLVLRSIWLCLIIHAGFEQNSVEASDSKEFVCPLNTTCTHVACYGHTHAIGCQDGSIKMINAFWIPSSGINVACNVTRNLYVRNNTKDFTHVPLGKYKERSRPDFNNTQRLCDHRHVCVIIAQAGFIDRCNNNIWSTINKDEILVYTFQCRHLDEINYWSSWSSWTSCIRGKKARSRRCQDPPDKACYCIQNNNEDKETQRTTCYEQGSSITPVLSTLTPVDSTSYVQPSKSVMARETIAATTATTMTSQSMTTSSVKLRTSIIIQPTTATLVTTVTSVPPTIIPTSDFCDRSEIGDEKHGRYIFNKSRVDHTINMLCKYRDFEGMPVYFTRKCMQNETSYVWSHIKISRLCPVQQTTKEIVDQMRKQNITDENVVGTSQRLSNVKIQSSTKEAVEQISGVVDVMAKCLNVTKQNSEVNRNLLIITSELLDQTEVALIKCGRSDEVLSMLNEMAQGMMVNISQNSSVVSFSSKNLALLKVTVNYEFLQQNKDIQFVAMETPNGQQILKTGDTGNSLYTKEFCGNVVVPHSAIPFTKSPVNIYLYAFSNDKLFQSSGRKITKQSIVLSHVIDVTIQGVKVTNLKQPVSLMFKEKYVGQSKHVCSFWKPRNNSSSGYWSQNGCIKKSVFRKNNLTFIHCSCDHLTNFAILLDADQSSYSPLELSVITYIGCIISIIGLFVTLITYAGFSHLRKRVPQRILINLSFSLMILLVVFLSGVERTESMKRCQVISVFIHMFTLSTFSWMVVECVSIYRCVVKTLHRSDHDTKFFWYAFAAAWVLPLLIAAISSHFSWEQFEKQHNEHCVIQGTLFYVTTLGPVSLAILFNACLFIPIIHGIHAHLTRKARFQQSDRDLLGRVRITISTMVLLGITWIFGLLAVGDMRTSFQWIFSILNSLQGFFIFIFHVVRSKEAKSAWCQVLGIEYDYYSTSGSYSATAPSRLTYTPQTSTISNSLSIIRVKTSSVSSAASNVPIAQ